MFCAARRHPKSRTVLPAALLITATYGVRTLNYTKIYHDFIADRKKKEKELKGYSEKHHILPVSLGGGDEKANLVRLTPSDHFFAHLLLSKIHGGPMASALFFMCGKNTRSAFGYKAKRWAYDYAKREVASNKRKLVGDLSPLYGRSHSEETKRKISKSRTGVMTGKDHFAYGKPSPLRGIPLLESTKKKLSEANSGERNGMHGVRGGRHPSYKFDVISFKNKTTGERFTGTQGELTKKYNLDFRNVSAVVLGKRKTVGGWQLLKEAEK